MMNQPPDTRSDATLVALVLAGERETFAPLLLRYYTSVARLCRRLVGHTPEAQDIVQEAALQAFLRLGELREAARFGAWLHAIAANLARMELRGGARFRSTRCRKARRWWWCGRPARTRPRKFTPRASYTIQSWRR